MRAEPPYSRLVLTNGLILADPANPEVVSHGWTLISGQRLVEVNTALDALPQGVSVIDCSGCLIMPGLVNAHNHAAMSLLRGVADDLPLDKWLNDYIFPAEANHATPDFVYLGTKLSAAEMALNGITIFADGYFHMEQAARAVSEVGLRGVIAQGILDVPAPDAPTPGSWKDRVRFFLSNFPKNSLVKPALFCHSPYLCSPDTYREASDLAAEHGILLFTHVSETSWEVGEIRNRYGLAPVEHLGALGILGPNLVAVHGVHLSDIEIDILSGSATGVVHCPESNMKLASGAARIKDLLARGVTVALGTDGPAGNNNLDLFEEMRSAALMSKLIEKDPEALDARTVLRMATIDGARVLGMDSEIGSLEPGKLADVIIIDMNRPHLTPVYDPISHLVYAARGSDVRDVIVNGEVIVRRGRLATIDEEDLKHRAQAFASDIASSLGMKALLGVRI